LVTGEGYHARLLTLKEVQAATVGVVPQALLFPALPREPWDVPVDHLATEVGVEAVQRPAAGPRGLPD